MKKKGEAIFFYNNDGKLSCDVLKNNCEKEVKVGSEEKMIEGKNFCRFVDNEWLTGFNGKIKTIYVNGYASNLGLYFKSVSGGGNLRLMRDAFVELCNEKGIKVVVDWERV